MPSPLVPTEFAPIGWVLSIPANAMSMMIPDVGSVVWEQHQVLNAIIIRIAVDVVDHFA